MKKVQATNFQKILVCQQRQIGDVLLATPAVEMLARAYPEAQIHFFTEKKCAPVLKNNPHLKQIWVLSRSDTDTLAKELRFYRHVAREGFDLVVDFQQLPRCRWLTLFSRARVRLSHTPPWYNRLLYTHWTDPVKGYAGQTKASILRVLGLEWQGERPRLFLDKTETAWSGHFFREYGIGPEDTLVTVDPSHRRVTRCWPPEHFARLMDLAAREEPSLKFLMMYGPGEEDVARHVVERMEHRDQVVLPRRVLSLREMAAVMDKAAAHLGNCSAPRHFAVALDVPSFVIHGATSDGWRFPSPEHRAVRLGLDCQPCNRNACPQGAPACLTELSPEAVVREFLPFLTVARAGGPFSPQ